MRYRLQDYDRNFNFGGAPDWFQQCPIFAIPKWNINARQKSQLLLSSSGPVICFAKENMSFRCIHSNGYKNSAHWERYTIHQQYGKSVDKLLQQILQVCTEEQVSLPWLWQAHL